MTIVAELPLIPGSPKKFSNPPEYAKINILFLSIHLILVHLFHWSNYICKKGIEMNEGKKQKLI